MWFYRKCTGRRFTVALTQYWKIIGFLLWLVGIKTWTTGRRNDAVTRLLRERESAKTTMEINDIWRDRDLYVEHR